MQADEKVKAGDEVTARILEVNKKDGIVDLSLKAALVSGGVPAKKGKAVKGKKGEVKAASKGAELEVGLVAPSHPSSILVFLIFPATNNSPFLPCRVWLLQFVCLPFLFENKWLHQWQI